MTIWANTIVNNEENFIWFAVMSVVDYVDKVLVYDTGSTDRTVEIIKEIKKIKGDKIELKEVGTVSKEEFPKVRQKMLEESSSDWILVLDGDEIWWENSIKGIIKEINDQDNIEGIVVPVTVPVGDIYHLQEEKAGQYELLGKKGHYNLRAINKKIPGLHVDLPYGKESYLDENNHLIYERGKTIFLNVPYLHVTHLKRSNSFRKYNKHKLELGNLPPSDFKYPEVFYQSFPEIVSSPWVKISAVNKLYSQLLTPLRKINRRTFLFQRIKRRIKG